MTNVRRYSFRACYGAVTAQRAVPTNFGFRVQWKPKLALTAMIGPG
jgi:hypothetical protein